MTAKAAIPTLGALVLSACAHGTTQLIDGGGDVISRADVTGDTLTGAFFCEAAADEPCLQQANEACAYFDRRVVSTGALDTLITAEPTITQLFPITPNRTVTCGPVLEVTL